MFADELQFYNYRLPYSLKHVRMVGWLESDQDYPQGEIEPRSIEKLLLMIFKQSKTFDLHVNVIRGTRPCVLCNEEIQLVDSLGKTHFLGMSEIWIPSGSIWYASPSLIFHYMQEHNYAPPPEYLEAIDRFDLTSNVISQDVYDLAVRAKAKEKKGCQEP